jgi:hypothetical protein
MIATPETEPVTNCLDCGLPLPPKSGLRYHTHQFDCIRELRFQNRELQKKVAALESRVFNFERYIYPYEAIKDEHDDREDD